MNKLAFAGALRRVKRVQKAQSSHYQHPTKLQLACYSQQGTWEDHILDSYSAKAAASRWQILAEEEDPRYALESALVADKVEIPRRRSSKESMKTGRLEGDGIKRRTKERRKKDGEPYLSGLTLTKDQKRIPVSWNRAVAAATRKHYYPLPTRVGDIIQSTDSAVRRTWRLLATANELIMQIDSGRRAHATLPLPSTLTSETVQAYLKAQDVQKSRHKTRMRWLSVDHPPAPYIAPFGDSLAIGLAKRCDHLYKFCRTHQMKAPLSLVNYRNLHSRGLSETLLTMVFAIPRTPYREERKTFKAKRKDMHLSQATHQGTVSGPRAKGLRRDTYMSWVKEARHEFLMGALQNAGVYGAAEFLEQCAFKPRPSKKPAQLNKIDVNSAIAIRHRISKLPWDVSDDRPEPGKHTDSFYVQTIVVEQNHDILIDVINTLVVPRQSVPEAVWQSIYWTYLAGIADRASAINDFIRRDFLLCTVKGALEHDRDMLGYGAAQASSRQALLQADENLKTD